MLFAVTQLSIAAAPDSYRGWVYPPDPTGCRYNGGGMWRGKDQTGDQLGWQRWEYGKQTMISLDRLLRYEGKNPVWQVEDALVLPVLRKNGEAWVGGPSHSFGFVLCEYKRDKSAGVIAIGTWVVGRKVHSLEKITSAWILNFASKTIEPVSPREVSCKSYSANLD